MSDCFILGFKTKEYESITSCMLHMSVNAYDPGFPFDFINSHFWIVSSRESFETLYPTFSQVPKPFSPPLPTKTLRLKSFSLHFFSHPSTIHPSIAAAEALPGSSSECPRERQEFHRGEERQHRRERLGLRLEQQEDDIFKMSSFCGKT